MYSGEKSAEYYAKMGDSESARKQSISHVLSTIAYKTISVCRYIAKDQNEISCEIRFERPGREDSINAYIFSLDLRGGLYEFLGVVSGQHIFVDSSVGDFLSDSLVSLSSLQEGIQDRVLRSLEGPEATRAICPIFHAKNQVDRLFLNSKKAPSEIIGTYNYDHNAERMGSRLIVFLRRGREAQSIRAQIFIWNREKSTLGALLSTVLGNRISVRTGEDWWERIPIIAQIVAQIRGWLYPLATYGIETQDALMNSLSWRHIVVESGTSSTPNFEVITRLHIC